MLVARELGSVVVLIEEMTREASLEFLHKVNIGRLGCSQAGQPYVVPIYFRYKDHYLYSFSTIGLKVEWMRANPLVCVETDDIKSSEQWISVVILGQFEELADTPEWRSERALAHQLLATKAMWWEPGFVKTILGGAERPLIPIFYRIYIKKITGHCAKP
jgi:uncharacterized protein